MDKKCIVCGIKLILNENWYFYAKRDKSYVCKSCICEARQLYNQNQKNIVLQIYSDGYIKCNRCGYNKNTDALTIDHIKGGGYRHRKELKIFGGRFYSWLIRNKFPKGYQVLCMNCQFIKRGENKEVRKCKI